MLNRLRLLQSLNSIESILFQESPFSADALFVAWDQCATHPNSEQIIKEIALAQALPTWQGDLRRAVDVSAAPGDYRVVSVDGSQIYPDRHTGVNCFLLNIGTVDLNYAEKGSHVQFHSAPYIFAGEEVHALGVANQELVNCKRQEYELDAGVQYVRAMIEQQLQHEHGYDAAQQVLLFDGSLIFWHLAAKEYELRSHFLYRYLSLLDALHALQMPAAWYISLPKSKELVNLLRAAVDMHMVKQEHDTSALLDASVDAHIAAQFLAPYTRTTVFQSNIALCLSYPAHLRPSFFYLHCGDEIGRVEIPAWIASDEQAVDRIASMLVDQARKGYGYPIALAEAHEQAVVKGPDRDFFYHCIEKMSIARKQRLSTSLKSRKKRGMGI